MAADLCAAAGNCWPAVWQMASGSRLLHALNSIDETPGRVSYTSLYSATDELVEPSTTVPLSGGANVRIQDVCPARPVHHAGMLEDAVVYELVLDAMEHPGPADPGRLRAPCTRALMPGVTPETAAEGNLRLYGNAARALADHPGTKEEPPLRAYAVGG